MSSKGANTLAVFLLLACLPIRCSGLLSWLFPSQSNFLRSFYQYQDPEGELLPGDSVKRQSQLVLNANGKPPPDFTCYDADVPDNPRTQSILITLESFCPSTYDTDAEAYCNHPERLGTDECRAADLPIHDDRAQDTTEAGRGLYKAAYTGFMRRLAPQMAKRGWTNYTWATYNSTEFWLKAADADIIVVSIQNFRFIRRIQPNKRYILVQTNDCASLSFAFGCDLDDPRILGVLQHTALNPISENNGRAYLKRRHFAWLKPDLPETEYEYHVPPFSDSALSKVHVAIPQIYRWRYPLDCGGHGSFVRLIPAFEDQISDWLKPFHERTYDVVFMGAITDRGSRDSGGVNAHRWAAVHAIQDMKRKHPHLNIFLPKEKLSDNYSYLKFLTIMRDTKFFISPYGLGEFSGKDYESILSGAILVKPLAERIESYPNIYSSSMTIRTELQFDDLEEKVMPYLTKCSNETDPEGCIRRKQEIEEFSKLNLIKLRRFMDLRNMADDWDRLLFSLASKKIEMKCGECLKPQKWMYTNEGVLLPREDVLLKAKMLDKQVSENFDDLYDREKMKWKSPDRADLQEAANYLAKGDEETSEQDDYQIILEDAK